MKKLYRIYIYKKEKDEFILKKGIIIKQ